MHFEFDEHIANGQRYFVLISCNHPFCGCMRVIRVIIKKVKYNTCINDKYKYDYVRWYQNITHACNMCYHCKNYYILSIINCCNM